MALVRGENSVLTYLQLNTKYKNNKYKNAKALFYQIDISLGFGFVESKPG